MKRYSKAFLELFFKNSIILSIELIKKLFKLFKLKKTNNAYLYDIISKFFKKNFPNFERIMNGHLYTMLLK